MDILAINKDTLTDDNINEIINKYYAHKQKKRFILKHTKRHTPIN